MTFYIDLFCFSNYYYENILFLYHLGILFDLLKLHRKKILIYSQIICNIFAITKSDVETFFKYLFKNNLRF